MPVSRFEATQGDIVRLRVEFRRNGAEFDPDSITRVQIRRRTGPTTDELIEELPGTTVVREAVGVYYLDWPIPAGEPVGAHVDRWFFVESAGDSETSRDADFVVFAAGSLAGVDGYQTVAEIREVFLPGSTLSDARIGQLIRLASDIAERYTGRYFGGRSKTITADGTGQAWIVLDEFVQRIDSMTVMFGTSVRSLDPADFVIKGRWVIHRDFLPSRDPWLGCVSICACPFGDLFERGQRNVSVTGIFGDFDDVPEVVKRAVGLLVKYGGQDEYGAGPMAANYSSESVEQHSYSLREASQNIDIRSSTGINEVDHLLNLVRKVRGRLSVI